MFGRFVTRSCSQGLTIRLITSPRVTGSLGGLQSSSSSAVFEAPRTTTAALGRPIAVEAFNMFALNPSDDGG